MKKILTILLALAISTSAFSINIQVVNNTNAQSGWKVKVASDGQFITRYRYLWKKHDTATFRNMSKNCTVQIVSISNIDQGTALSSSKITLRKDINSNQNETIYIKECDSGTKVCENATAGKEESEEEVGKNNKHYYLD